MFWRRRVAQKNVLTLVTLMCVCLSAYVAGRVAASRLTSGPEPWSVGVFLVSHDKAQSSWALRVECRGNVGRMLGTLQLNQEAMIGQVALEGLSIDGAGIPFSLGGTGHDQLQIARDDLERYANSEGVLSYKVALPTCDSGGIVGVWPVARVLPREIANSEIGFRVTACSEGVSIAGSSLRIGEWSWRRVAPGWRLGIAQGVPLAAADSLFAAMSGLEEIIGGAIDAEAFPVRGKTIVWEESGKLRVAVGETPVNWEEFCTVAWEMMASGEDLWTLDGVLQKHGSPFWGGVLALRLDMHEQDQWDSDLEEFLRKQAVTLATHTVRPVLLDPNRKADWSSLAPGYLARIYLECPNVNWEKVLVGLASQRPNAEALFEGIGENGEVLRMLEGDVWGIETGIRPLPQTARSTANCASLDIEGVVVSGRQSGFLETCGCKAGQFGGLARRESLLKEFRLDGLLAIDCGGFLTPVDLVAGSGPANRYLWARSEAMIQSLGRMSLVAIVPSLGDICRAPADVLAVIAAIDQERGLFVGANLATQNGEKPLPPYTIVPLASGKSVAVVGWIAAGPQEDSKHALQALADAGYQLLTGSDELGRCVMTAREEADFVIVAGSLRFGEINSLLDDRALRGAVDLIVTGWWDEGALSRLNEPAAVRRITHEGASIVKDVLVVAGLVGTEALTVYEFLGNALHGVSVPIGEWVEEDSEIEAIVASLGGFGDEEFTRVTRTDMASLRANFVGAEACRACHEAVFVDWLGTPHATAMRTLRKAQRETHPDCVRCHVTGYGFSEGYVRPGLRKTLEGIQCEVCHGAGSMHAASADPLFIERTPPRKICLDCHDPEHSDQFLSRFDQALRSVSHATTMGKRNE